MSRNRITQPLQAFSAHTLLLCFTIFLVLKIDHLVSYSWWIIFFPLFLFHAIVARGRFSLPGSFVSHGRYVPFLVVFELLLCVFLERTYAKKATIISLKIVFLPLLAFELTVLVFHLRIFKALLSEVRVIDNPIWETLRHFCVVISMGFSVVGTVFTLRKLSGDISSFSWWKLYIWFGIAEFFAFLAYTNWSNTDNHTNSQIHVASSSSMSIRCYDLITCIVGSTDNISEDGMCGLQDIGGHFIKICIIIFHILLCMRLEGEPAAAKLIPIAVIFSPIFLLQGFGVLFAALNLIMNIVALLCTGARTGDYFVYSQHDSSQFVRRSTNERNRREQTRLHYNGSSRYNTFSEGPPETANRLPKTGQIEEIRRILAALYKQKQSALNKQKEIANTSRQNCENFQNEKILCKICFDADIDTMLLPCGHHCLCRICSDQCQKCPFCRAIVEKRKHLPVYNGV